MQGVVVISQPSSEKGSFLAHVLPITLMFALSGILIFPVGRPCLLQCAASMVWGRAGIFFMLSAYTFYHAASGLL
jgi:hypothetical protein